MAGCKEAHTPQLTGIVAGGHTLHLSSSLIAVFSGRLSLTALSQAHCSSSLLQHQEALIVLTTACSRLL